MGTGALMALGTRAMFANYAALQTVGNNIANANTEGYSRQEVQLETAGGQFTGAGFFGKGVNVATVTRSHDEFLTREAAGTASVAARDKALSEQLQQLEKVFTTGESGLGYTIGQVFNAFADVASKPQDTSSRQVVLARVNEMASRLRSASDQLNGLQAGVTQDLKTSVDAVNALSKEIASLNQQIASVKGFGHTPNDLLDQRDTAIAKLSEYIQVSTIAADDGSMSVFIGGGQKLILGNQATELAMVRDAYDPSKTQLGIRDAGIDRELPAGLITGGSLAGLLTFQNRDLTDARNQLGQLAAGVASQLNAQQALGLDLTEQPGAALLSVGGPQVLTARGNTGGASVSVTLDDTRVVRASDYELTRDTAGSYTLRRVSDDHVFQSPELPALTPAALAAGIQVDGLTIRVDGNTALNDRFLIRPVANAARDAAQVLTDPRGLAAASPVSAAAGLNNTGTVGVQSLQVLAQPPAPVPEVVFRFAVDATTKAVSYTVSTDGGATYSATPQPYSSNQPIDFPAGSATPQWRLTLGGNPADGDLVRVQRTPVPSANNGNANALLALRDVKMVGGEIDNRTGTLAYDPASYGDAYSNILGTFGVRVQTAKSLATQSASVAETARSLASNTAGVNLDEEAARLIQFQQSYQAAAKMLQVAQSVFDTLLQTAGR
ncbi:flagellar hook-associated protein FlgK [Piscinibacter sakaiensis]|uniref:Flagellar hook-associated protein 1 n=1 Tax=Piscinibacter sakaiensis TaxID=1547922 RepID=A0A0K8NU24_PISS1|nr:flagellar hook-associated protein FlgK [Piscinibacter sakaiensis]GAP33759.1 flagellar hook-associated protein FlgK [Piscinibacter sakaiensis]